MSPRHDSEDVGDDMAESLSHTQRLKRINWLAWLQVFGYFCIYVNTLGLLNTFGEFQTYYTLELLRDSSPSQISWIGSIQAFLLNFVSIFSGPVFEAGHFRLLLCTGTVLTAFGLFMTSLCDELWQCFLAQGLCVGLGLGCPVIVGSALVSQHFKEHRSLAIGIGSTGAGIGGIIYPLVFSSLQQRVGFPWATRSLAFIVICISAIPIAVMRYPKDFIPRTPQTTEKSLPFHKYPWELVKKTFDPSVLRDSPFNIFCLGIVAGAMSIYCIQYYINLFAIAEIHITKEKASYILVILNAASIVGRVCLAPLADRVGAVNILASTAIASCILAFCLLGVHSLAGLIVWTVLIGFSTGAFIGLPAAGMVNVSSDGVKKVGTRLGLLFAEVGCGTLVAEPIAGALIDSRSHWTGLIIWCGVLLSVASIAMASARISKTGWHVARSI